MSCGFIHNLTIEVLGARFVGSGERKRFKKILGKFMVNLQEQFAPISYIAFLADASFENPVKIHMLLKLPKPHWPDLELSVATLWESLCDELKDDFLDGSTSSIETLHGENEDTVKLCILKDFISMLRINNRNCVRQLSQFDEGFLRTIFL
jgi:hypothetical protein